MKLLSHIARLSARARIATVIAVATAFAAVGVFKVQRRHQVIHLGYALSDATSTLRQLEEEDRRLRLELSVLTNPTRIEKLAESLGMIRPSPSQVRNVRADKVAGLP